jgi:pyruvate,orthophosphate dikinase
MRIAVASIAVLLAGCETLVPVAPSWPKLPEQSDAARPCAELAPIKAEPVLSEISKTINEIEKKYSHKFSIKIGTMIELPRAALTADKISPLVDYFSFGTNDLTQTTLGISRDDTGSFLGDYIEQKIFNHDPFITIDEEGVGFLVQTAIEKGKKTNNTLSFGVCGEHAGDPKSIDFFHKVGMDYISCSPFRVPIARVAAARSKIINQ